MQSFVIQYQPRHPDLQLCPLPLLFEISESPLATAAAKEVLDSLLPSQNPDGGFGSFDARPGEKHSTLLDTHGATEIIIQAGILNRQHTLAVHPVVTGIIDFLKSEANLNAPRFETTYSVCSNRRLAPWWKKESDMQSQSWHPIAAIAGFALAFAPRQQVLYANSLAWANHLIRHFLESDFRHDAKAITSMKRLIGHLNTNKIGVDDAPELYNRKIRQQLQMLAETNRRQMH